MTAEGSPDAAGALRLFVALDLPVAHRREVVRRAGSLRGELPPARWVKAEAMHLTLVFLGDTPPRLLDPLSAALAPAFAASVPFDLVLSGGGTFPPRGPARAAWVAVHGVEVAGAVEAGGGGATALVALQGRVADAVADALERPAERKRYHPHVTVARPRRPWNRSAVERFAAAFETPVAEPFRVGEGVLYRSRLDPGGAIYTPLERFPLAAPREETS